MTHITLLTEADCENCDLAKEILHFLSAEFEFTVTEVDLASERGRELSIKHTVPVAPGLLIDGVLFSSGRPSMSRLRKTLASIRPIGA